MTLKQVKWLGDSRERIRDFPDVPRHEAGYQPKFSEAVYVLHAFQKKSRKTPKSDLDLARKRFRDLVQERKRR